MALCACAVQFLHFIPLQRNILHCATVNCNEKRVCAPVAHKINYAESDIESDIEAATKVPERRPNLKNYQTSPTNDEPICKQSD